MRREAKGREGSRRRSEDEDEKRKEKTKIRRKEKENTKKKKGDLVPVRNRNPAFQGVAHQCTDNYLCNYDQQQRNVYTYVPFTVPGNESKTVVQWPRSVRPTWAGRTRPPAIAGHWRAFGIPPRTNVQSTIRNPITINRIYFQLQHN
jgi:hypothetical protein